jgi:hypothetical protein
MNARSCVETFCSPQRLGWTPSISKSPQLPFGHAASQSQVSPSERGVVRKPFRHKETPDSSCGLGAELVLLLAGLRRLLARIG